MISCYILPGQVKGLTRGRERSGIPGNLGNILQEKQLSRTNFLQCWKESKTYEPLVIFFNNLKTYKPQKSKACVILSVLTTLKSNSLWKLPLLDFSTYDTIYSNYYYGSSHNQLDVYTGFGIFSHVSSPSQRLGISSLMVFFYSLGVDQREQWFFYFLGPIAEYGVWSHLLRNDMNLHISHAPQLLQEEKTTIRMRQ